MDYYKIGQRIRKCRRDCNLTQEELAEKVDISTTHMSHIETGVTKLSLAVLVSIAHSLNVSTDSLLFEEKAVNKNTTHLEIDQLLADCSPTQAKILADILRAAKQSMDKYR